MAYGRQRSAVAEPFRMELGRLGTTSRLRAAEVRRKECRKRACRQLPRLRWQVWWESFVGEPSSWQGKGRESRQGSPLESLAPDLISSSEVIDSDSEPETMAADAALSNLGQVEGEGSSWLEIHIATAQCCSVSRSLHWESVGWVDVALCQRAY